MFVLRRCWPLEWAVPDSVNHRFTRRNSKRFLIEKRRTHPWYLLKRTVGLIRELMLHMLTPSEAVQDTPSKP